MRLPGRGPFRPATEVDLDRIESPGGEAVDVLLVVAEAALAGAAASVGAGVCVETHQETGSVQRPRQPWQAVGPLGRADTDFAVGLTAPMPPADVQPDVAVAALLEPQGLHLARLAQDVRLGDPPAQREVGVPAHVGGEGQLTPGWRPDRAPPPGLRVGAGPAGGVVDRFAGGFRRRRQGDDLGAQLPLDHADHRPAEEKCRFDAVPGSEQPLGAARQRKGDRSASPARDRRRGLAQRDGPVITSAAGRSCSPEMPGGSRSPGR